MEEAFHVEDQRDQTVCYHIAVTDAISIMYRRKSPKSQKLLLSPQVFIDSKCKNNVFKYLREPYGLQSRETYAFTMINPHIDAPVVLRYNSDYPRYHANDMYEIKDRSSFKSVLEANFGDIRKRNPMIGCMKMGPYKEAKTFDPYTHNMASDSIRKSLKAEPPHAMVIVGIETDDGKSNCYVKNSYGEGWGARGFGQVNINDLISIEMIEIE
uniref:cathepsin K-like n=1 Tax=Erigeron canadensis TaxID=72917 RepID=UPI001CB94C5A|nr:cathepsin K-like [Erigeron canadensis]